MVPPSGQRKPSTRKLRNRILRSRGISVHTAPYTKRFRALEPTAKQEAKTTHMLLIEGRYGKPIEEILLSGSSRQVAKRIGVNFSTVTKWIDRLGIRYTPETLPDCGPCVEKNITCQQTGYCPILIRTRALQDTIIAKKRQVLGE